MITPNVTIGFFGNHASIPTGFVRETGLDGRFPKGAASGQNPNTTGGAATHTHTSPVHEHTMVSHSHTVVSGYNINSNHTTSGSGSSANDTHYHSSSITGVVGGTMTATAVTYGAISNSPPYTELIFIRSTGYNLVPDNGIVFWGTEDAAPDDFFDCDGDNDTVDLTNQYPRGAATDANAGATGGSTTNNHDITHGHGSVSHSHFAAMAGSTPQDKDLGVGDGPSKVSINHTHNVTLASTSETPNNYVGTAGGAETVEPAYRKLRALQNTSGGKKSPQPGMIGLTKNDLNRLPPGWVLCDGNNDTPDMRDRYLKIANDSSEVGDVGGANTHTHALGDAHTHIAPGTHTHSGSASRFTAITGGTQNSSTHAIREHDHNVSSVGTQTSSWNTAQTSADSANNEPEYRTFLFIQYKFAIGAPLQILL